MKYRDPITGEFKEIYVRPAGDTLPLGGIIQWDDLIDIPANWLRCNGSAISRTEYINLFNIIGTTYGIGDGSTTFNLPNIADSIIKFNNSIGLVGKVIDSINGTSTTDAVSQNQVKIINDKITANRSVIGNETDTYSASSTYALGDLVIYNSLLYKCTTAITVAEVWNSAKWTQVSLTNLTDGLKGKILWTNPNPTTAFASQTINLTNNECKNIKIICGLATDAIDYENIYEFRIGKKGIIFLLTYANSTQTLYGFQRNIDEITNNSITFSNCLKNGASNNSNLIPKIVIGF